VITLVLAFMIESLATSDSSNAYLRISLIYGFLAAVFEYIQVAYSADALRYIDQDWNMIAPKGKLCPSLFYEIGICNYWQDPAVPVEDDSNRTQVEVDPADDDDAREQIIGF